MTVRVNKPAFNIRDKLSELERPIGVKGSELMKSKTIQEARDSISAGRKNLIINGDMRIAQRGTTSTVDNGYGCIDRWFKYSNGDTNTWGQATDAVHGTYAYWVAKSNGYGNLRQRIEPFFVPTNGINYVASFWMKISSGIAPLRYEIWNNTDQTSISNNMQHDILTTDWKKYTINFRLDSVDSMDNWHLLLGSNDAPGGVTFYLTKVQIEEGDTATEFEHRPIGEELTLCQRYYQRFDTSFRFINAYPEVGLSSGDQLPSFPFPVPMRTAPSMSPTTVTSTFDKWNATGLITREVRANTASTHWNFQYFASDNGNTTLAADYHRGITTEAFAFSAEI
tara:strand:- start:43 stop:1056 length:1014 start_codon:yes stop_codon:yes gene_type:complete